jgi:glycosyltransferase involved in cell wall biosynthesis
VPSLLAAADLFVLPSRWEGQSLILQEALRAGRPIVATRSGGTPELTGEDGALLVPPDDPVALTAAVRQVLTDPARAAQLAEAAQARARTLPSPSAAVEAALAVYRELAGQPQPLEAG